MQNSRNRVQQNISAQTVQMVETRASSIQQRTISSQGTPQPSTMYRAPQRATFSGINITGSFTIVGSTTGQASDFRNITLNGDGHLIGDHHPELVKSFFNGAYSAGQSQPYGHKAHQNGGPKGGVPNSNHRPPVKAQKGIPQKDSSKMISDKPHTDDEADKMDIDSDGD
ncbi:hypothetical protein GGR51DRAFT_566464 [Nemania sp. FL0031]|nr:hypothetical protein GGR51DRAFT_566464 [Nemania sp. FL0031]